MKKTISCSHVSFLERGCDWVEAAVLAQQPKRSGMQKDWVNMDIVGDTQPCSMNWCNIEQWRYIPPPENVILLTQKDEMKQDVIEAKYKEVEKLERYGTFEVLPFQGQETISSRWVITQKEVDGKKLIKARLVARGFEEDARSAEIRTDSPTCKRFSLRLVLITASTYKWKINSLDVASAFLQSNEIEREVFLCPPADICSSESVWKLKRPIYGLCDAPRSWYDTMSAFLVSIGGVKSAIDDAMFMWFEKSKLIGHLACHVDDVNYTGTNKWNKTVIKAVKEKFNISSEAEGSYKYIGLNILQGRHAITIDQSTYITSLEEIPLSKERQKQKDDLLNKEEKSKLRSLSGQMLWVTTQTRPDFAYEACRMSNVGKSPTVRMIIEANKAVKHLKSSAFDVRLAFPHLGDPTEFKLMAYSDASHNSLPGNASQGAFIVFVCGDKRAAPLIWQSRKLRRVTKSPLASETSAFGEAADAGKLMGALLKEVYNLPELPKFVCHTDSKSLFDAACTSNTVEDKSMTLEMSRVREMVSLKELSVKWISKDDMVADVMTKRGASYDLLRKVLIDSQLH